MKALVAWQRDIISYLRVSTDKQGRSGLGIEAQRDAVASYLNGGRWTLAAEYVETESGRRSDRPKLAAALSHAKAIGAKLVFAKLDRLTRNVDLLRSLVASGVDLDACQLSDSPSGRSSSVVSTGTIFRCLHRLLTMRASCGGLRETGRHPTLKRERCCEMAAPLCG
jgi:hypothetical protein